MSIWKPKGSPYYWFDFQFKGRRFYGSTGTTKRSDAKDIEAAERTKAVREQHYPAEAKMTMDVAAAKYWTEVTKAQPSAETTDYQLANLVAGLGKATLLSHVTGERLAEYVARRRAARSHNAIKAHGRSCACSRCLVSPASVNREIELLRRVLYRARDVWGVTIAKIDWKAHKLQEADERHPELSQDQEARLHDELADHLKAPFRFTLLTGLRKENVFGMDWSQIDLLAREITFHVKSRKPGGKVHVLPITDDMLVLLANQGPKERGLVFTNKGRQIRSIKTAWKAAQRRAGLEGLRWHDLRHVAGTRMVQRGVDISVVQEVLGHSEIATTRRYVHHDTDAKRRGMEALSQNSPKVEIAALPTALKHNA